MLDMPHILRTVAASRQHNAVIDASWSATSLTMANTSKFKTTADQVIAALDAAAVVALQEEGIEPEDVL